MILVTGAAGKTGRAVIQALVSTGETIRALVHRAEQRAALAPLGVHDVIAGDMRAPTVMADSCTGARAVYHIAPNMHPDEMAMGAVAIDAARTAGVEHFVYHSVLHPQTESMPHHWRKLRVEEHLLASGLSYTILQPAPYMQNVQAWWQDIVTGGRYRVPYAAETTLNMVDLQDVATVAASVLTESGHNGATYQLCGPETLSQHEAAAVLEHQLGRRVRVEVVPRAVWRGQARAAGLDEDRITALLRMFEYYERHGLPGNARVLAWLLGRQPTTFARYVERTVTQLART